MNRCQKPHVSANFLLTKAHDKIMMTIVVINISRSNEKEEYADTIPREDDSLAVRLSEYDLWKVAFELKSPESQHIAVRSSSGRFPLKNMRYAAGFKRLQHNEGGTAIIRPSHPWMWRVFYYGS